MKTVWFIVFVIFIAVVAIFYFQETVQEKVDIHNPESDVGKAVDDSLGLNRVRYLDRAKEVGTRAEFSNIKTAIVMYYTSQGRFPENLEQLVEKGYISQGVLTDFYQQYYRTEIQGNELVITSAGKDRVKNTQDDIVERIPLMP